MCSRTGLGNYSFLGISFGYWPKNEDAGKND